MEVFEMIFNDNGNITTVEVKNEPVGYDAIDFNLNQEEDRYGRDWSFAGDAQISLEFTEHANPEVFYLLEEFYEKYGFEADVKLKITDGQEFYIGNLDFLYAEYNGHDTFKFKVNQETEEGLIKKRADLSIDLFGIEDLDGNISSPVTTKAFLLPAKQIFRESVWENVGGNVLHTQDSWAFNYSSNSTKYDLKNTLSFLYKNGDGQQGQMNWSFLNNFKIIDAKTDILNAEISIDYNNSFIQRVQGNGGVTVVIRKGAPANNEAEWFAGEIKTLDDYNFNGANSVQLTNKTIMFANLFTNSVIKNGEGIWVYFIFKYGGNNITNMQFNNVKFTIKAYEQTFDVVTDSVNLYDAVKKVVHDASGMEVVFPMAQSGVLKNTYIFNGNMVRNIKVDGARKPFTLSFDNIKKWFPELNLDYEIMENKKVYIGKREDYYTNNEIDAIDNVAFDSYKVLENERYAINQFTYKYGKYQSQKENTEENTNDIVHGEAEYHVNNMQVENLKSVEVDFVRDPFMLQETVNAALNYDESKATQDDDTVFIIDASNMVPSDYNKSKTSVLFHRIENDTLKISNDGTFRWDLLGIYQGSSFEVLTAQNAGSYIVMLVTPTVIELQPNNISSLNFTGETFTSFQYVINNNVVKLKPYFFPKFSVINPYQIVTSVLNIKSPETFANLRYSIGLNIRNYYTDFISTCVKNDKLPKQLKYVNNNTYENNTYTPKHYENADIKLTTPILSTKVVETALIMPFERYMRICKALRSEGRGFIRSFDPKGNPVYLYPQSMKALYKTSRLKEVTVVGEVKNIPEQINITKSNGFYNVWIHKFEIFQISISDEYLIFKDPNGIPFYKKSHYSKIKVNNQNYNSPQSVINAINAL